MTPSARSRVLVVEDEPVTRELVVGCLVRAGFVVTGASDADEARAAFEAQAFDLLVLDVELPGEDGFSVARFLRSRSNVAIIFLTRRADVVDRVVGLELGGDDYIVKPPDVRELTARARAVLRRRATSEPHDAPAASPSFGGWRLDADRRCLVAPRGEHVAVSPAELSVLQVLVDAGGHAAPRTTIAEVLRDIGASGGDRSLEVLIHRLRRKLGEGGAIVPRVLLTVHGFGYRLAIDERVRDVVA